MLLVFSSAEHFTDLPYNGFKSGKCKKGKYSMLKTGRVGKKPFVHCED